MSGGAEARDHLQFYDAQEFHFDLLIRVLKFVVSLKGNKDFSRCKCRGQSAQPRSCVGTSKLRRATAGSCPKARAAETETTPCCPRRQQSTARKRRAPSSSSSRQFDHCSPDSQETVENALEKTTECGQ